MNLQKRQFSTENRQLFRNHSCLARAKRQKSSTRYYFLEDKRLKRDWEKFQDFPFLDKDDQKIRSNFSCVFFFLILFSNIFLFFSYIFVYCVFLWLQCFFSIFGNFFSLSYMVLGLKWQQRREAFSALRNRMKNSYSFL